MARDRQRAKQRRKRQGGPAAPRGGGSSANAREIGLDDATADEAGLGEVEDHTPNELKHSSADVDEALLAERGAIPPNVGDDDDAHLAEGVYDDELVDDDFERAPDDAPEDVLVKEPGRRGAAHPEVGHEHAPARKQRGRVLTFLRHSADELRRVQWPNRQQVGSATAVVLGFVVIAGAYLGLLDALWKPIVDAIL
jgi:preprotein translocase subunit SecE